MHTTEKIAKNHAYRHKRYRGVAKIMHTTAFDAAILRPATLRPAARKLLPESSPRG